jgi:acyl-CoA thioester hydrolase
MANDSQAASQFLPTSAIQKFTPGNISHWFEYPVVAYPHHTDYGGIAWHGSYIAWMEEARIECLRSAGVDFADLVAIGCDLPVVEIAMRYHQPVRMGMKVIVKTCMSEMNGVRINWDYQIESVDGQLLVTACVTLVAVSSEKGRIMRQLPPALKDALLKLAAS